MHVSEMSWTKKNVHPGKIVSTSQEVEVHGARDRRPEAARVAGPQADPGQPVGESSPATHPNGHAGRGRGQEHHRVRSVRRSRRATSTAWSTCRDLDWNRSRRGRDPGLPQGRHGQGRGHRRRRREGAHLALDQGGRAAIPFAEAIGGREARRHRHRRGHRDRGRRHRGRVRRDEVLHPPLGPVSRDRSEQRPERFPRATRSTCA